MFGKIVVGLTGAAIVLAAVLAALILLPGMGDTTSAVDQAANTVRSDGRQEAVTEIVGDGGKLTTAAEMVVGGSDCQARLNVAWQYIGNGKINFLEQAEEVCRGSELESDWLAALEKARQ